jgi:hypothetical protein
MRALKKYEINGKKVCVYPRDLWLFEVQVDGVPAMIFHFVRDMDRGQVFCSAWYRLIGDEAVNTGHCYFKDMAWDMSCKAAS